MQDLIALPALILLAVLVVTPQLLPSLPPPVSLPPPLATTSLSPTPAPTLPPPPTIRAPKIPLPTAVPNTAPWGVARQIDQHTWQIRINNDPAMGSPSDILQALNNLRARYGAQPLQTDPRLCAYAQKRADYFKSISATDDHRGLTDYLQNGTGFADLGYNWVGENSSYGYVMSGVHLIEFVYNSDPDHSKNQLDPKWDHGCVGVNSPATDLIFATSPR